MSFVAADAAFGPRVAAAVIAPSERKLLRFIRSVIPLPTRLCFQADQLRKLPFTSIPSSVDAVRSWVSGGWLQNFCELRGEVWIEER
jgi:hypothetical protein